MDGLLMNMTQTGARGLRLAVGSPARMIDANGAAQDASTAPLTRQEILTLLSPIIPEQARRRLPQESTVDFDYVSSEAGAFKVTVLRNGTELAVSFVPDKSAPAQTVAAGGPAAPALAAAPVDKPVTRPVTTAAPAGGGNAIDALFRLMVASKSSDLHLSSTMPPLIRKDGHMQPLDASIGPMAPEDVMALLHPIMPVTNREEFESRHDTDFAYEIKGLARFRANMFLDRKGPGAVFRVIPAEILTAEQLGLSPHILQLCRLTKGLVLVTGPTGSGKSTTLCAMIDYINKTRTDHINTIEDPIEFVHENQRCLINQRDVGTHTGGFTNALRAAMREDPDLILVGELRDLETVAIAIETAE
ncbi:MAG: ATPase, T2SS/T4P/T4SS family, partial [Acidobacteriota bacterium]|nr:ATPase, T2SS/T4P/T4SS family [Acidobacteriota bacterium]